MKKFFLIIGAIFFTILVAIISVPLFVDVDKYRPLIIEEANKRINGTLELGKLKMSLWGALKIHAESIKLSVNGFKEPLLDTDQFHLELPFMSIISGHPQVVAVLKGPKIFVTKDANGKMNIMELMKKEPATARIESPMVSDQVLSISAAPKKPEAPKATAPAQETKSEPVTAKAPTQAAPKPAGASPQIPAILVGATLGIRIEDGNLEYQDRMAKGDYKAVGLEVVGTNLGLGNTMNIRIKAPLKGSMQNISFEGPVNAAMELTPILVGNVVKSAKGSMEIDATKMSIGITGGLFKKTDSMPLTASVKIDGNEKEILVRNADVQFQDFKLHAKGRVTLDPMTAKMEITSDPMHLEKIQEFVPMVAEYQLKGVMNLNTSVTHQADKLSVNGDLKLSDGSFFMKQYLKEPLHMQLQAGFSENTFNIVKAVVTGPDSDISLQGNVRNFMAPQFSFALSGKSLNVDKTIVLPEAKKPAAKEAYLTLIPAAYAEEKKASTNNPMAEMAKNPMIMGANGTITAQLGKFIVYNTSLEQVNIRMQMQNLLVKLQEGSFKTFGGDVKTTGEFDVKSLGFTYKTQGTVTGISAKEGIKQYFPKYQNTLEGKLNANWNMSGAAFPETVRMKSISGGAKIAMTDGALKSVDFQSTINSAMQKVPFLKDKKPIQLDDGFKSMTADMKFQNGTIQIDPMEVQPRNRGFVIKGKSKIEESLDQESFFDVYDPQGILPKEFNNPGKAALALHLTGSLMSPKTDYEYTVKKLAGSAGKNVAKNAIQDAIKKQMGGDGGNKNDAIKNLGDQLKKKIKFF